jgi:hypothetical protein
MTTTLLCPRCGLDVCTDPDHPAPRRVEYSTTTADAPANDATQSAVAHSENLLPSLPRTSDPELLAVIRRESTGREIVVAHSAESDTRVRDVLDECLLSALNETDND